MHNPIRLAAAVAAGLICAYVAVAATSEPGLEGWGRGQNYDHLYDPNLEVCVPATVLKVESFVPQAGMSPGVRGLAATGRESLWVHFGPAVWMDAQNVKLEPGDAIVVTGALISAGDGQFIMAAKLEKGTETLKLRGSTGAPAWAGFHRHR